ncbi:MAG: flotillin-like FloA family protein, partial [Planctomycetota bacterium]
MDCGSFFLLAAEPDRTLTDWWPYIVGGGVGGLLVFILVVIGLMYGGIYIEAWAANANVKIWELIGMSFRRVNSRQIVRAKITVIQAGIGAERDTGISTRRLEAHYLAGGNVHSVVRAIVAAHRADIDLDFDRAAAIDLAGRDVHDAVRTSVDPKVIDCPDPKRSRKTT